MDLPVLYTSYKWNHNVSFGVWLLSFSIILSRFIHVVAYINTSFLFLIKWYSTKCINHTFCPFILQWTFDLGQFLLLAVVNSVAMDIPM